MRYYILYFALVILGVGSCNNDPEPEPLPDEDRSYITLYNFLVESFEVKWYVDDVEVLAPHSYGTTIFGGVLLDEESEDISFVVNNGFNGLFLESNTIRMTKDKYYIAVIFGTEEDPVLLIQELETTPPTSDHLNIRFLHATENLDTVDVYMGGTSSEKLLISGLTFGSISDYEVVSENDVKASVTVTLHDSIYKEENELLSYKDNNLVNNNSNNLTVIAPSSNTSPSELTVWLYEQPKD